MPVLINEQNITEIENITPKLFSDGGNVWISENQKNYIKLLWILCQEG